MDNTYLPKIVRLKRIVQEAADTKTFYLEQPLDFTPGQFLEISCLGIGEAPVSISSSPSEQPLKLTFKRVGCVTTGLFNLKAGDYLGIRGPFGNGFPVKALEKEDLVLVAGGIGIAPLRSLLKLIVCEKKVAPASVSLVYGARTPKDLLYKKELEKLEKEIRVLLTVDKADNKWKGRVGVVSELLNAVHIKPSQTKAVICGPAAMLHFTTAKLVKLGMNPGNIIVSLERHMKCGIGKCGHCYIADKFICRDGPVFTFAQLKSLIPREIF